MRTTSRRKSSIFSGSVICSQVFATNPSIKLWSDGYASRHGSVKYTVAPERGGSATKWRGWGSFPCTEHAERPYPAARCARGHPPRSGEGSSGAVHGLDLGTVLLVDELALELHGRRQFVVLGGELPLDQVKPLDRLDAREIDVDLLDLAPDQVAHLARAAQAGVIGERDGGVLGEFFHVLLVDHDEAGEIRPAVADHDGVADIGREFELVLDLRRRDVLASRRDDDVLHAVGDAHVALVVDEADVAGMQPAV